MKNIPWQNKLGNSSHIVTNLQRYKPGCTGHATYKDVTVHLQIIKKITDILFHAVVIGFSPPTATLPDLQVTDEVEVGIQHFLPD
jgi:hypothetical protein